MTRWKDGLPDEYGFDRYGDSPYYDPPEGLEILGDVDIRDESYEYHQVVVWRDKATGALLAAADSGCSCPTPFGDLTREGMLAIASVDDLRPLFASLDYDDEESSFEAVKAFALKEKVRMALSTRATQ